MRATGHDEATIITPPREIGLDLALEWISEDELVEVTPENVRMRKKVLKKGTRPKE
jgi:GTP-binding protein